MTTIAKQNGTSKKESTTAKKAVQEKLAKEAMEPKPVPVAKEQPKPIQTEEKTIINLDDRMQKFEQLKGLAHQRERLSTTLTELNRFKYNQSDSASFYMKDSQGLEFKTTNTNLIQLVTNHLKATLEHRKAELEKQLIEFEL
ncbi:hypothetical protein ACQY1Q_16000 [Tenacibaculum sp. TC6]|uniref:hypothetical protein n=1 Tax=Tenacibaculum sp. TC6 TaxID=3423223 RepID=UPI003D36274C